MGLSDFEKDIQRKLREREIVPSEKAWEKLNVQLPQEKAKKAVTWYWVAAAVIILISAGIFINSDKNELQKPAVVNMEKENRETIQPTPSAKIKEKVINEIQEPLRKTEKNKIIPETINPVVAAKEVKNETEIPEKLVVEAIEEEKVTEIVLHLETLQNSGKEITEAMVDSLLIEAQRELVLERTFKGSTGKVDGMALLKEVENDLDKSFRDKVFEALEGGFIVIKTAVADRN